MPAICHCRFKDGPFDGMRIEVAIDAMHPLLEQIKVLDGNDIKGTYTKDRLNFYTWKEG